MILRDSSNLEVDSNRLSTRTELAGERSSVSMVLFEADERNSMADSQLEDQR